MSWAEIKKAVNSDLSTPLNTLITNSKNDILDVVDTGNTFVRSAGQTTNALNVTINSKGKLLFFAGYQGSQGSGGTFKIDDVTVASMTATSGNAGSVGTIITSLDAVDISVDSAKWYITPKGWSGGYMTTPYSFATNVNASDLPLEVTNPSATTVMGGFHVASKPIPFNKLELSIKACDYAKNSYVLVYTLDE